MSKYKYLVEGPNGVKKVNNKKAAHFASTQLMRLKLIENNLHWVPDEKLGTRRIPKPGFKVTQIRSKKYFASLD